MTNLHSERAAIPNFLLRYATAAGFPYNKTPPGSSRDERGIPFPYLLFRRKISSSSFVSLRVGA
jgi:hypothetical protein